MYGEKVLETKKHPLFRMLAVYLFLSKNQDRLSAWHNRNIDEFIPSLFHLVSLFFHDLRHILCFGQIIRHNGLIHRTSPSYNCLFFLYLEIAATTPATRKTALHVPTVTAVFSLRIACCSEASRFSIVVPSISYKLKQLRLFSTSLLIVHHICENCITNATNLRKISFTILFFFCRNIHMRP